MADPPVFSRYKMDCLAAADKNISEGQRAPRPARTKPFGPSPAGSFKTGRRAMGKARHAPSDAGHRPRAAIAWAGSQANPYPEYPSLKIVEVFKMLRVIHILICIFRVVV